MTNPFNITFGKVPNSLISRTYQLEEVIESFSNSPTNSNVYILTGVRGSGKTVEMTSVCEHFKNYKNYICLELNPESDMLEQLAAKIYDEGSIKKLFIKKEFSLSYSGFTFQIKGETPISNISTLLSKEFEYLKKKGIRVLISVDEAVSNNYMKIFVHEFQTFIRSNYDVY